MEIPVYLLVGFLDSGKTSFIKDTIEDEEFSDGTKTLLIACEDGEEEYNEEELKQYGISLERMEEEGSLTEKFLLECQKKYKPERVMIEYNGMWAMETLFALKLPPKWEMVQVINTVDATTFELYINNIRALMMGHFSSADMVIFNRCDKNTKMASCRRSVKAINPRAQVYMENADGTVPEPDETLPFDIQKERIEIEDSDFGIWYIDVMDSPEKYEGKTVKMLVQVYKNNRLPGNAFVPGRFAMTCCADDIRFIGPLCVATPTMEPKVRRLQKKQWIYLTAKVKIEYSPLYKAEGPVLYTEKIEPAEEPEETLVYFN